MSSRSIQYDKIAVLGVLVILFIAGNVFSQLSRSKKFNWSTDTMLIDSLKGRTARTSGALIAGGTASVDSLFSTKGVKATSGTFSTDVTVTDDIFADSAFLRTIKASNMVRSDTITPSAEVLVINGTNDIQFHGNAAENGEVPASAGIANLTGSLSLSVNSTTGNKIGAYYYAAGDGWHAAWEIANVGSGHGDLLLLKGGGNVGIGVADATTPLHVSGNATITGDLFVGDSAHAATVLKTGRLRADSIYAGTAGWFRVDTATFPCSLFDGLTYRASVNATYEKIGKFVTINIPFMQGTITASQATALKSIPAAIQPMAQAYYFPIIVKNAGATQLGMLYKLNNTTFTILNSSATYLDAGTGGIAAQTIRYKMD